MAFQIALSCLVVFGQKDKSKLAFLAKIAEGLRLVGESVFEKVQKKGGHRKRVIPLKNVSGNNFSDTSF
ncbi:MAG: hypothetical protein ACI35P_16430 [Bacillus sp. (in: firmicutes)]